MQRFPVSFRLKLGVGSTSGSAEVGAKRVKLTLVDLPGTGVYQLDLPGGQPGERNKDACLFVNGLKSLTVVHTTQETIRPLMGSPDEQVPIMR